MHGSTKAKVPNHGDSQSVYSPLSAGEFASNGIEIQQCLTGVLISPVTAVDDRHATSRRKFAHGSGRWMPHDDGV